MKIEIHVDHSCKEPEIIVMTNQVTEEIKDLVKRLSEVVPQVLVGFRNGGAEILEQDRICRIYAEDGKVVAITDGNAYVMRLRLYELEERLDKNSFVRISNSEIINLQKVKSFDLSLSGTICVKFNDGAVTYVSRRYVAKINKWRFFY